MIRSGRPEVILCVHLRGSRITSWSVCRGCLINGPSAGHSPGCSKVTLTLPQSKRGVSRGPRGTASWHVKAAPSAAALQQTLCNGLFWICISFASHMGSVFPFSLFFLIAFFLVIIISVSLPSSPFIFHSWLWLVSVLQMLLRTKKKGQRFPSFSARGREPCQRGGGGRRAPRLADSSLWPQPASCASGEVCQIAM